MRALAAISVLALALITFSLGCGSDTQGPPFEPGDIDSPESLLITNSDIREAGFYSAYGTVLRWWQALQLGDVETLKQSYTGNVSGREARRQIEDFGPRFSQPIDPEIRTRDRRANLEVRIRTAARLARNPDLISVRDFTTHFYLFGTLAGYKVRLVSYRNYSEGRRNSRLAVR